MKKPLLSLMLICNALCAIPTETVIVGDAQGAVQHTQVIAQFVEAYKKYEQMLQAANDQINKLNEINNLTNKANDLINNGNLNIANPMQVLDNLNNTLKSIKRNADRLAQNARDYDIKNAIRLKQLQNKCGDFLKIDDYFDPDQTKLEMIQTGEETMVQADVKNLLETFTDIKANEIDGLAGGLKGLPLAIVMCDRLKEYEKQLKNEEFHSKTQSALLSGDFEEYKKQQQEKVNYIMKQEAIERKEFEQKLTPLKVRMLQMQQTLGVTDINMAKENGIEFCKETKNGGCAPVLLTLDYVKNKEAQMLENARKNSNANTSQSQADREFIMLDYLREIATHMSFLNETMAMTAAILAEEKEGASGVTKGIDDFDPQLDERKKEFKEKVKTNKNAIDFGGYGNAKLDQFGFPKF